MSEKFAGKLDGQVALVIGGGRNLGRQIAHLYAAEGATVCIVGRSSASLEAVVAEIEAAGGVALFKPADVTRVAEIDRLVAELVDAYGRIDILVNTAGIFLNPTLAESTEDEWSQIMDINLKAPFFAIQKVSPVMARNGGGSIINMSSVMGVKGRAGSSAYCAAKAGVINLTRALALELGGQGIRVNALAPGFTLDATDTHIPEPVVTEMTQRLPVKRAGTSAEIAAAALYLAAPESAFTTGTTIFVDGGETSL